MALVQNTWFPNALRTEPGQTIYGATPWQTMQQAYQQPQNMLASNATVGQPIAQQPYQSPTVRTLPDLAPVQSTVRPPGTMPMMASQQVAAPPVDTGGGTGDGEDKIGPGMPPPGPTPQPTPTPTPTVPPTGDPRYGRLDAPVWDWSQGPPRRDTPGGFWLKSPWAERWGNQNNPADTVYVPEGMTFGRFLASPSNEVVTDGVLRAMLAKLLDEINVRASDQYKYRPGAVGAQQIVNMNPSEKEMLMGQWESMGLSGDDMWQMMLRAMPKGNAQTMTRWG